MNCQNNREIERKFLVTGREYRDRAYNTMEIRQGLLSFAGKNEIRITIRGERAFICIKSMECALNRFEWNKEITVEEAELLLKECCISKVVSKTRYLVLAPDNYIWEIDEFHGDNEGLVVAEVELPSKEHYPDIFPWIGEEVTGNPDYYNSVLSFIPFKDQELLKNKVRQN